MIDAPPVQSLMRDKALTLGVFQTVSGHEPKSAPQNGVTCAIWLDEFVTVQTSGLDTTSMKLVFDQRIYMPMISEPQDAIDPAILDATQQVMNAYCGDFTLGGGVAVRCVDIFGAYGDPLGAKAGYINQDSKLYRAMVLTVPLIIDDVFDQEA